MTIHALMARTRGTVMILKTLFNYPPGRITLHSQLGYV